MATVRKYLSRAFGRYKSIVHSYVAPYRWEYCLGGILILLILFSQMYGDFFVTYRAGINFWYALFEGHPLSFYSYAGAIQGATPNRVMASGAAYDFTIYAFFAIWNLPAYLYERISGSHAESCFLLLAWGKLMFPVLAIVIARGMKKILVLVTDTEEDSAEMLYAYMFSGILIMAVYLIGQYDIIGVVFAVYGLYYFLKKDYKRFYLYFGAAITCKYFAAFLFIALVLIYEKRILYIIRDIAVGFYLVVIEKFLFGFGKSYAAIHAQGAAEAAAQIHPPAAAADASMVGVGLLPTRIKYLFHLKTLMGVDSLSVFMLLVALIWVYCYLQKRGDSDTYDFYYKVIYIAFCINAVFILYTASTPYWALLFVPWMILTIYCRADNRKLNLLLETIGTGCFIVWHFAREPYFFVSENCEGMLFYYLLGRPPVYSGGFSGALSELSVEGAMLASPINMIRSVFYVCFLILLIVNFPAFCSHKDGYVRKEAEPGMRGLLAFRMICMTGALLLPAAVYVVQVVLHNTLVGLQTAGGIWGVLAPYLISY